MADLIAKTVVYDIDYKRVPHTCTHCDTCDCIEPRTIRVTIETEVNPEWRYAAGASIGEMHRAIRLATPEADLHPDDSIAIVRARPAE